MNIYIFCGYNFPFKFDGDQRIWRAYGTREKLLLGGILCNALIGIQFWFFTIRDYVFRCIMNLWAAYAEKGTVNNKFELHIK